MKTVTNGESLKIREFGSFRPIIRPAHYIENPLTGGKLLIPEATVPRFVPGLAFKQMIAPKSKTSRLVR